jgi:hypothetical protein
MDQISARERGDISVFAIAQDLREENLATRQLLRRRRRDYQRDAWSGPRGGTARGLDGSVKVILSNSERSGPEAVRL